MEKKLRRDGAAPSPRLLMNVAVKFFWHAYVCAVQCRHNASANKPKHRSEQRRVQVDTSKLKMWMWNKHEKKSTLYKNTKNHSKNWIKCVKCIIIQNHIMTMLSTRWHHNYREPKRVTKIIKIVNQLAIERSLRATIAEIKEKQI